MIVHRLMASITRQHSVGVAGDEVNALERLEMEYR